jgi:hypothetical protein
MMLLLASLFVVATAIGSYVAVAVAGTLFAGERRQQPAGSSRAGT